ncbi:enoyl-CoA hydratase/isomerase family protein [Nocardia sp. 348MFTsu5.1]|uniref:enoyl-CoA hydratase/isomerase family protein n=1 Tax=Nocardia sp. 348MFTsu5.1 TaxID=1172185 RepID=UPI0004919141|nr:enoyl-CoA hydratase-related protein [Nocardia sp. 348MFTsu5.1]
MSDSSTDSGPVLVDHRGAVRLITLNRPHLRNAIDFPMRYALAEAIEQAMDDADVRALVITGAGGAFCSGGDISTMGPLTPDQARTRLEAAQRVIRAIWNGSKPVVAAVEGPAFGAGAGLALGCDRVVAARDSSFGTTFTAVGLSGDMGISVSLPARIGLPAAKQLLMLPRRIGGEEAGRLGLADSVVEPGTALESALADADRLAQGPPLALAAIKSQMGRPERNRFDVLDDEVENQVALWQSDDFAEGVAAFKEKRTARFLGR